MAVKEKVIAKDIDGNELQEGDRVQIVELGGMSSIWLNKAVTIAEFSSKPNGIHCKVFSECAPDTKFSWRADHLRKISSAMIEQSELGALAAEIMRLHEECEKALNVARVAREAAREASRSALEHAKLCGESLVIAKRRVGHGAWEAWRGEMLRIPSSTGTLYQRVFERWHELESMTNIEELSLRKAAELLKKPRKPATLKSISPSHNEADLPATQSIEHLSDSSEHLNDSSERYETTPDYGEAVSEEIAESLMNLGVMPCKPSISPEEFNREMAKSGLITQDVKIINPRLKRCEFLCNGVLKNGVISGVLFDWKRMTVAAVLIDYDDGKQIQVPSSNAWLIDESNSESNDQPINRFAAIEEIEAKGWYWDVRRSFCKHPGDYCYSAHLTTPDVKKTFSATKYECLEDALENCIEQAKTAGLWEVEECQKQ